MRAAAPAEAPVARSLERQGVVSAGVLGEGAPGMEATAGRELAGLGHMAGQKNRAPSRRPS